MRGHRGARLLALAAACAAPALYAGWVRPRLLTWGATREEATGAYPGDELVEGHASTMAVTLPAPPERVWPWLAQMGADRGGWYSWDVLDHYGEPSADHIVPEWQSLREGQRLNASRDRRAWFTVAAVQPNRMLVLRSSTELPSGHSFDIGTGTLPHAYMDGIWAFHLRPDDGDATRLVVRTRGRSQPRRLTRLVDVLAGEPLHFIMQTRQFHNLRARVGAGRTPIGAGDTAPKGWPDRG